MTRVLPFLLFILIAGGVAAFIYKDRLFPKPPGEAGQRADAQGGGGGGGGGGRRRSGGQRRAGEIVPVLAEKARVDNVPVFLSGVGTTQAFNTATVRAQVSGRLTEVNFREGQDIKQGEILAKIDPVLYQAAYDQTVGKLGIDQALLNNAKRDAQRFATLAKSDFASQQQADTAKSLVAQYEAQARQDQAAVDTAKANLDYTTVRAPIDGRTGIRLVDIGNLVSATDATGIVVITQLQPISVVFTLPENAVGSILEAKSKGVVAIQGLRGTEIIAEGTLEVVDNQIDQATGTVKLKGKFPNNNFNLWPGQFLTIKLRLKTLENAVVVPTVAIQQGASGSYVFVAGEDSTAKLVNVKVVQEGERQSVIGEGIAAGVSVITSGFASLQDGTKIRVDSPATDADGTAGRKPTDGGPEKPRHRRRDSAATEGAAKPEDNKAPTAPSPTGTEAVPGPKPTEGASEKPRHRRRDSAATEGAAKPADGAAVKSEDNKAQTAPSPVGTEAVPVPKPTESAAEKPRHRRRDSAATEGAAKPADDLGVKSDSNQRQPATPVVPLNQPGAGR